MYTGVAFAYKHNRYMYVNKYLDTIQSTSASKQPSSVLIARHLKSVSIQNNNIKQLKLTRQ